MDIKGLEKEIALLKNAITSGNLEINGLLGMIQRLEAVAKQVEANDDSNCIHTIVTNCGAQLLPELKSRYERIMTDLETISKENSELSQKVFNLTIQLNQAEQNTVITTVQEAVHGKLSSPAYKKSALDSKIIELYEQGMGATAIGRIVGLTRNGVINRLKKLGLWVPKKGIGDK